MHGPIDDADAVVAGDAAGFYRLMVDRDLDAVSIEGTSTRFATLLAALPRTAQPRARRDCGLARAEVVEPAGLPADPDADATRRWRTSSR